MMNGYSVTEAASVLGVPTERVWELLARGVLAGAPEGETGMRVFLQPRSAPAAPSVTAIPSDDPVTASSNGPERELSPFRELLTEFRSLTERYGQALLALGEARGEVASLRSRVDLLEARIDLRLPSSAPTAAPWPTQPLPVSEPAEHEEEAHRRRRRGARRATESFAEALARAEDPSVADLPGGTEAARSADAEDLDRSLPRDVLPAEPVLVADEASETVAAAAGVVARAQEEAEVAAEELESVSTEPHLGTDALGPSTPQAEVAAEELVLVSTEPDQVEVAEPPSTDETETMELEPPDGEPLPVHDERAAAQEAAATSPPEEAQGFEEAWEARQHEPDPETASAELQQFDGESIDIEQPPDLAGPDQPSEQGSTETAASEELPAQVGQDAEEPARDAEPEAVDFDDDRYSTVIEQPDWLEAEADPWPGAPAGDETADVGEVASMAGAPAGEELDAAQPARDQESDSSEAEAPESGADEMEVAGGGQTAPVQAEEAPEATFPGSRELDEALEAFGDLGTRASLAPETEQEWPPADRSALTPPSAERLNEFVARARQQTYDSAIPGSAATRAYRRLRRVFPT